MRAWYEIQTKNNYLYVWANSTKEVFNKTKYIRELDIKNIKELCMKETVDLEKKISANGFSINRSKKRWFALY